MNLTLIKKESLFFFLVLSIGNTVFSQDSDKKWIVGIGVNVVDIRTPSTVSGIFKDYFNQLNSSRLCLGVREESLKT